MSDAHKALEAKIAALEQDNEDLRRTLARMSELLTGVADALKGPPGPLAMHDWSDLPKLAAETKRQSTKIPKHFRIALANAQHAFETDDLRALGTANEDLQQLIDAAIGYARRLQQGGRAPLSPPLPAPNGYTAISDAQEAVDAARRKPPPACVLVRARDIRPGYYALWCSVGGSEPFANPIVLVKWSEDRSQVVLMLDTQNFDFRDPDELIELIPLEPGKFVVERYGPDSGWTLDGGLK